MGKIKRGKNRVDISSGGYLLKHDNNNLDPGDKHFRLERSGLDMIMVYPKKEKATPQRMEKIKRELDGYEAALFGQDFTTYRQFVDLDSFVEYFLITELTKNPDGYRGSTFLHKGAEGVLKMGPVWDYNEAYGLCCGYPIEGYFAEGHSDGVSGGSAISTNGWRFNICSDAQRCIVDPLDGVSQWYRMMWKDSAFQEAVEVRWRSLRSAAFSDARVKEIIGSARSAIEQAAGRNNQRWAEVLGYGDAQRTMHEVSKIESWTLARMAWIDSQLNTAISPDTFPPGLQGFKNSAV